jgi:Lauroyl/myristoyl acyltransferase
MYFIFKIIALLPLWLLQNLALMIAFILNLFNSSIKRITSINIQLAYPDLSETAQRQLVSQSIRSQCLTYIEFIKCWGMPPSYSLSLLKNIYGEQILTEALANKKRCHCCGSAFWLLGTTQCMAKSLYRTDDYV